MIKQQGTYDMINKKTLRNIRTVSKNRRTKYEHYKRDREMESVCLSTRAWEIPR